MNTLVEKFLENLGEESVSDKKTTETKSKSTTFLKLRENFQRLIQPFELEKYTDLIKKIQNERNETNYQNEDSDDEFEDEEEENIKLVNNNEVLVEIENNLSRIFQILVQVYQKKFPGLEDQVRSPLLYVKVVKKIRNKKDINGLDFSGILPNRNVLVLKLTLSNSGGTNLTEEEMKFAITCCEKIEMLSEHKDLLLKHISSKMEDVAPNLCAIIGPKITAQLIGLTGGLTQLSKLPSSTILLLGRDKKSLQGLASTSVADRYYGVIGNCDIVQNSNPDFRAKAARRVANKSVLAIRNDCFQANSNEKGLKLREEILAKLAKIQEAPPAVQEKPLPIPGEYKKKTQRGGKNARRRKELYGPTEVSKKMNRLQFGVQQVEDFDTGQAFGLLGVETGKNKIKLRPKTKAKIQKKLKAHNMGISVKSKTPFYGGNTNGLASSLAFTPLQGMSLVNPALLEKKKTKKRKYFDNFKFRKPEPRKRRKIEK